MANTTVVRVLIVEDNPDDCQLIRQMLALAATPYAVACCESLAGALAQLRDAPPNAPFPTDAPFDVLLLDLQLNDVSMQAAQRGDSLRAIHQVAPQLPVVVLSGGVNDQEAAARLLDAGAAGVVKKMTLAGTLEYDRVIQNALLTVCPVPPPASTADASGPHGASGPRCPLPGRRGDDPAPDCHVPLPAGMSPHTTGFRGYGLSHGYGHAQALLR